MLLLLLQKAPIVVEVVKQPQATPSISYGSVLLSAVALVGVILLASLLVGVNLWAPPTDPGHARLRI